MILCGMIKAPREAEQRQADKKDYYSKLSYSDLIVFPGSCSEHALEECVYLQWCSSGRQCHDLTYLLCM